MLIKFLNTNRSKKYLWRYFDLHKFLSFVNKKEFFFARLDSFDDSFEAISHRQLLLHFNDDADFLDSRKELDLEVRQKRYFASCWCESNRESAGLWDLYSDSSSVAIKVERRVLVEAFSNADNLIIDLPDDVGKLYIGSIFYKDFFKKGDRLNFKMEQKILGFHKDESFRHEGEFRFLMKQEYDKSNPKEISKLLVKLKNFDAIQFEVILHPRMDEWKKESIKAIVRHFNLANMEVKDSELKFRI